MQKNDYEVAKRRALGHGKPFLKTDGRYLSREQAHDRERLRLTRMFLIYLCRSSGSAEAAGPLKPWRQWFVGNQTVVGSVSKFLQGILRQCDQEQLTPLKLRFVRKLRT